MNTINERQTLILESLAKYTYLIADHFVRLGVAPQAGNIRERYLRPLIKAKFIESSTFYQNRKKLPNVYFLTKQGANAVAELWRVSPDAIYYPKGKTQFTKDYDHRAEMIHCLISMDQWAKKEGHEVEFIDSYFHALGSQKGRNLEFKTSVRLSGLPSPVIPDCNFMLHMKDGEKRLFTLELHRQPKTKRILEQLYQHAQIIREGVLSDKYNHPQLNYVCSIHRYNGDLQNAIHTVSTSPHFEDMKEGFFFASLDDVKNQWGKVWKGFNKKKLML